MLGRQRKDVGELAPMCLVFDDWEREYHNLEEATKPMSRSGALFYLVIYLI